MGTAALCELLEEQNHAWAVASGDHPLAVGCRADVVNVVCAHPVDEPIPRLLPWPANVALHRVLIPSAVGVVVALVVVQACDCEPGIRVGHAFVARRPWLHVEPVIAVPAPKVVPIRPAPDGVV